MRIISGAVSGVSRLARLQELSRKARQRLKWFDGIFTNVVLTLPYLNWVIPIGIRRGSGWLSGRIVGSIAFAKC